VKRQRRVLVVDDDELTLEILDTILDLEDFQVQTVRNGAGALAAIADAPPDVVVLDVMMPDIDGLEVCRRIRADVGSRDIPIVLLTARDQAVDRREGLAAGADAYVTKPFSPLKLIETITEIDSQRRRRPQGEEVS
jgi:DNA-binding response OmpR family regulator